MAQSYPWFKFLISTKKSLKRRRILNHNTIQQSVPQRWTITASLIVVRYSFAILICSVPQFTLPEFIPSPKVLKCSFHENGPRSQVTHKWIKTHIQRGNQARPVVKCKFLYLPCACCLEAINNWGPDVVYFLDFQSRATFKFDINLCHVCGLQQAIRLGSMS